MATRIRVQELKMVPASQLVPSAKNFRRHTDSQRAALNGILDEVGFAGAIVVRQMDDGRYEIIDGHMRADVGGDEEVPVVVTDLDDQEAAKVLATYDAIGGMAEIDLESLNELVSGLTFSTPELNELVSRQTADIEEELKDPVNLDDLLTEIEVGSVLTEPSWLTVRAGPEHRATIQRLVEILNDAGIHFETNIG